MIATDGPRRSRLFLLVAGLALVGSVAVAPASASSGAGVAGAADLCLLDGTDDRCEKWVAVYDDPELYAEGQSASDSLEAMAVSPTGDRVFTLGQSGNDSDQRWALVANNAASGDQLWVVQRSALETSLADLAVSADGARVYVTGVITVFERAGDGSTLANTNALTTAYNAATGQVLWERSFGGFPQGTRGGEVYEVHSEEAGLGVAASPTENTVYVTGYRDRPNTFYDVLVIAYNGSTGAPRWVSHHDGSSSEKPYANDKGLAGLAEVGPDGQGLYLGGAACTSMRWDPCGFLATGFRTSDGTQRWAREDGPAPGFNAATDLEVSPDGSLVYLMGMRDDSGSHVIAAYDTATGGRTWVAPFAGAGGSSGTPRSLAVGGTGNVVVGTGVVGGGYRTLAFDASTGEQLWATSDGLTSSRGVAVSPDGAAVYVAGQSGAPLAAQTTVAYDAATGERTWIAQFRRDADAGLGDLVEVGPDGTVFAAGTLAPRLGANSRDRAVVAYDP